MIVLVMKLVGILVVVTFSIIYEGKFVELFMKWFVWFSEGKFVGVFVRIFV